jgi:hypothetical protein
MSGARFFVVLLRIFTILEKIPLIFLPLGLTKTPLILSDFTPLNSGHRSKLPCLN